MKEGDEQSARVGQSESRRAEDDAVLIKRRPERLQSSAHTNTSKAHTHTSKHSSGRLLVGEVRLLPGNLFYSRSDKRNLSFFFFLHLSCGPSTLCSSLP